MSNSNATYNLLSIASNAFVILQELTDTLLKTVALIQCSHGIIYHQVDSIKRSLVRFKENLSNTTCATTELSRVLRILDERVKSLCNWINRLENLLDKSDIAERAQLKTLALEKTELLQSSA